MRVCMFVALVVNVVCSALPTSICLLRLCSSSLESGWLVHFLSCLLLSVSNVCSLVCTDTLGGKASPHVSPSH